MVGDITLPLTPHTVGSGSRLSRGPGAAGRVLSICLLPGAAARSSRQARSVSGQVFCLQTYRVLLNPGWSAHWTRFLFISGGSTAGEKPKGPCYLHLPNQCEAGRRFSSIPFPLLPPFPMTCRPFSCKDARDCGYGPRR